MTAKLTSALNIHAVSVTFDAGSGATLKNFMLRSPETVGMPCQSGVAVERVAVNGKQVFEGPVAIAPGKHQLDLIFPFTPSGDLHPLEMAYMQVDLAVRGEHRCVDLALWSQRVTPS